METTGDPLFQTCRLSLEGHAVKSCIVFLALILCLTAVSGAQTYVYHPANTPAVGQCNSFPFDLYTKWRFQFIIPHSVLGPVPMVIKDIALAPCTTGWFSAPDFQMRMGHTTYGNFSTSGTTKFDTILGPSPVEVYRRGQISWHCRGNTWSDLGLTTPFLYSPPSHLCVEIRYNSTTTGGVTLHTDNRVPRAFSHAPHTPDPFNALHWKHPIPGEYMGPISRLEVYRGFLLHVYPDTVKVNHRTRISIMNGPAGHHYQVAASLGRGPFHLGTCHIHLSVDHLFWNSLLVGPPVFNGYTGTLDSTGSAVAWMRIPNIHSLVGIVVYHAAISYVSVHPSACTNTDSMKIIP